MTSKRSKCAAKLFKCLALSTFPMALAFGCGGEERQAEPEPAVRQAVPPGVMRPASEAEEVKVDAGKKYFAAKAAREIDRDNMVSQLEAIAEEIESD